MKFFIPKDLIITESNIAELEDENGNNYIEYDVIMGYNNGEYRLYNNRVYSTRTTIYPLANFIWENLIAGSEYALNLHTQTRVTDPTSVSIIQDVTVVYVRSNNSYYIANKTAVVDFTNEDIDSPSNFTKVDLAIPPYRHEYNYPPELQDTSIYWKYQSVSNKQRPFDKAISSQAEKDEVITYKFSANAVSGLALLNVEAQTIDVLVTDTLTNEELYNDTITMIDTSHLDNYEKACTLPWFQLSNKVVQFSPRYSQEIITTISNPSSKAKIGVIKAGLIDSIGEVLDGVNVKNKSYNTSGRRENGEYVWNPDDKEDNKVFILSYNIMFKSETFDSAASKLKAILDNEVVLIGDDRDKKAYQTLLNYGAITSNGGDLMSQSTHSNATIEIENFI